jgi:hypothetical protein
MNVTWPSVTRGTSPESRQGQDGDIGVATKNPGRRLRVMAEKKISPKEPTGQSPKGGDKEAAARVEKKRSLKKQKSLKHRPGR